MASLEALSSFPKSSRRAVDSRQSDSEMSSKEFSIPSSFAPSIEDSNNVILIRGKQRSVSTLEIYSQDGEESVNSEQQLALRIDKETKPHHHLLRLLKEMELSDESSDPTKGEAVASLIEDFEKDVTLIQQKIQNEKLLKYTAENPPPLPHGWIALECPDSGDIYYENEETGVTTWDRPGLGELDGQFNDSAQSNDSDENTLPPNWIALEDPDSGDIYFANEVTGETTWDRPERQPEKSNAGDFHGSYNQHSISSGHDDKSQNEHSTSSVRFNDSYNIQSVISQQIDEESESSSAQDDDGYNISYNPELLSSDQEISHNSSYHSKANNSDFNLSGQTSVEDDDDEGLPEGWYSAIDPDSNERYYCNDETGESQWERPEQEQTSQESSQLDEDNDQSWQDKEDESEVSGLPEGWEAILDPSSGEYYYYNWNDGMTTWDKPPNRAQHQTPNESNSTQSDDRLPEHWFAVDDPSSGDTYYYNELTNETSWERPSDDILSVQENNNIVYEEDSVTSSKY